MIFRIAETDRPGGEELFETPSQRQGWLGAGHEDGLVKFSMAHPRYPRYW